jgi:ketosteroid isomerase-like protein
MALGTPRAFRTTTGLGSPATVGEPGGNAGRWHDRTRRLPHHDLARQVEAEEAIHNGDLAPRLAMWSTQDPVTLFGAATSKSGSEEVRRFFPRLASRFSDCTAYRFELVAAGVSRDLAYTVGYEHTSVSMDGVPVKPYTLRVTHVYRREDDQWRIVHRHGDSPPVDQSPPAEGSRE